MKIKLKYNTIKIAYLGFAFLFSIINLPISNGQSFIKEIITNRTGETSGSRFGIEKNGENTIVSIGDLMPPRPTSHYQFNLINTDKNGAFKSGYLFDLDSISDFTLGSTFSLKVYENYRLFSFANLLGENAGVVCADVSNNTFWARRTKKDARVRISSAFIHSRKKVIATTRPYTDDELGIENIFAFTGLAEFDLADGTPGWSYTYHRDSLSNPFGFRNILRNVELPNEDILLSIYVANPTSSNSDYPGILKISPEGEVLNNILFDSLSAQSFLRTGIDVDRDGNLFVSGHMGNRPDWNNDNRSEGFIAKFDSDLNLKWAKRLHAENFSSNGLPIKVSPEGDVIFAYYTTGEIPVILGKIDTNGELLWTRGYAFYSPQLEVGGDGSFYFFSARKFLSTGGLEPAFMIGKAEPNGDMADCPQFSSCVTLFDLDLPYSSTEWYRIPADTLPELPFRVTPFNGSSEDYCQTPPVPTAQFQLPDTICQNQCLSPDSLNNTLAHAVNWTIHKDSLLFETEALTFDYCFNTPGTYQIEQEIWLLGCSEFFTHELVVLPDSLGGLLGDDRVVCEDSIIILTPNATRPLKAFEWSDGSSLSNLIVSESGTYEVEVSDGFCTGRDRVAITFFEDVFTGTPLVLPSDTAVCEEFLPYSLIPQSDFSNEFFINNDSTAQSVFEIKAPGNYQIKTNIEGCEFVENFNLGLTPCEVEIYIPSSFSPNNDGINDLFEPLGNDFVGKQLTIFDRWGGKLFETKNPPFSWDGNRAEEGVYVLTFSYFNLRNNKEELISADVLVVR